MRRSSCFFLSFPPYSPTFSTSTSTSTSSQPIGLRRHLFSAQIRLQPFSCVAVTDGGMEDVKVSPATPYPNVVIGDLAGLECKKEKIRRGGLSKLQVVADFDMTLTKYMVKGSRGQSSHSLLSQGNPEYDFKRQQLFEFYYPLEISPDIPTAEKTKYMEEWWEKTHSLLVEGGLDRRAINQSVCRATIEFRDGVAQLFGFLQEHYVPVLIFSAGLADIIEEVIDQKLQRKFNNVRIISNKMEFDAHGNLIGFKGKTIHVLNKNEHALELSENGGAVANNLEKRTNVLLLGDHLGDLGMSDGFEFENRISIGFLNENVDSWLEKYKHEFDIVLTDDASMTFVINLVQHLAS